MEIWLLAFIFVGVLALLLLGGCPVAVSLAITGLVLLVASGNAHMIRSGVSLGTWEISAGYTLAAIPLFMLMGRIVQVSSYWRRAFRSLSLWFARLPGGLLHTNITMGAVMAAASGSSVANTATLGVTVVPQELEMGYGRQMVYGSVVAGGALGILIPPSIVLIIYGTWTVTSVGELFIAGVIPGVILSLLFMTYILVWSISHPTLAPSVAEKVTWKDRVLGTVFIVPPVALAVVVLGSLFAGIATPTEVGAIGVAGALVFALISGGLSLSMLKEVLYSSVLSTSMLLFILVGGKILAHGLVVSGLGGAVTTWIVGLPVAPLVVISGICVLYLILGCFLEGLTMMVITIPVIFPVLKTLGMDPVLFGVMLVVLIEAGMVTPPFGMNLFVLQGVTKEKDLLLIARGAIPFVIAMILTVILLVAFPAIALWLPGMMMK